MRERSGKPGKLSDDQQLLEHIRRLPHGRTTYKQLVRELGLQGEDRGPLEDALDRLCDDGRLVELRSGHYLATGAESEYVVGRLSLHRDGYGFLLPDGAGAVEEPATSGRKKVVPTLAGDVFLPPAEAAKGMHGDRALVHVTRRGGEGRAEGEVLRILRRAHQTIVGEFRVRKRGNFVVASDERIQQWIAIPGAWRNRRGARRRTGSATCRGTKG